MTDNNLSPENISSNTPVLAKEAQPPGNKLNGAKPGALAGLGVGILASILTALLWVELWQLLPDFLRKVPEILGSGLIASIVAGIITGYLAAEDFGTVNNLTLLAGSGIMGGMIGGYLGLFTVVVWIGISIGTHGLEAVPIAIVTGLFGAIVGSIMGSVTSVICGSLSGIHMRAKQTPRFHPTPIRLTYGAAIGAAIGAYLSLLIGVVFFIVVNTT